MKLSSKVLDLETIRSEFPILQQELNGAPLIYLDNAATSQTPNCVLNVSRDYYQRYNSNIHRGTHKLSQLATAAHEEARRIVAQHIKAPVPEEVIFTSGCTDSINLVAFALGLHGHFRPDDEIIISQLEHHSNIVPWQMVAERSSARIVPLRVDDKGSLDLQHLDQIISDKTRLVAINHVSNALGTINPVEEITRKAKQVGALVLVDGAQSLPHLEVDVQAIGCDFYAFSGHKVYAPTGIGVLWGRYDLLNALPPWRGGGEMIKRVSFSGTTYNDLPFKFEAGTPNIEGGIALGAALQWLQSLGLSHIAEHEHNLTLQAEKALGEIEGLKIFGQAPRKAGVISFLIDGIHPYDLGTLLDQMGIAVRTGHHCCQPLMERFGISGTIRASFAAYNTPEEVDRFVTAVRKASMMLR